MGEPAQLLCSQPETVNSLPFPPHVILFAVTGEVKLPLALIFDVDGVLVHSMPLHVLAWEEYLLGLGIKIDDLEQRMHGRRNAELVRDLISSDLDEDVIFQHGAAKEKLFRDMLVRHDLNTYRIPGLLDFLDRHRNLLKAVASNAEPQNIDFVLDRFGLRSFFAVAVNGLQVKRAKPFPDVYLEAAANWRYCPRTALSSRIRRPAWPLDSPPACGSLVLKPFPPT